MGLKKSVGRMVVIVGVVSLGVMGYNAYRDQVQKDALAEEELVAQIRELKEATGDAEGLVSAAYAYALGDFAEGAFVESKFDQVPIVVDCDAVIYDAEMKTMPTEIAMEFFERNPEYAQVFFQNNIVMSSKLGTPARKKFLEDLEASLNTAKHDLPGDYWWAIEQLLGEDAEVSRETLEKFFARTIEGLHDSGKIENLGMGPAV